MRVVNEKQIRTSFYINQEELDTLHKAHKILRAIYDEIEVQSSNEITIAMLLDGKITMKELNKRLNFKTMLEEMSESIETITEFGNFHHSLD